MTVHADYIALGHVIAFGQLHAVVSHAQALFSAIFGTQYDVGLIAFAHQLNHGGGFSGPLGFFGLIDEVLRDSVPAPFVGHQRGGVIQRARQTDEHQHG